MVEGGSAASSVVVDTGGVGLEGASVGLNGDGEGLLSKGGLKLGNAVGGDLGEGGDLDTSVGRVVLAGLRQGSVGVGSLGLDAMSGEVFESPSLVSTVATKVEV